MMGGRSNKRKQKSSKCHFKLLGAGPAWIHRCRVAVQWYFSYLNRFHFRISRSRTELDENVGEYINFLYQDDRPIGWAADLLGGLKRFSPSLDRLETAKQFHRNWARSITRKKAHPFTCQMVQAMAAYFCFHGQPRVAFLALLAFAGLFRLGDLFTLRMQHVNVVSSNFCVISLLKTKAARGPESVVIRDELVISILAGLKKVLRPSDLFFEGNFRKTTALFRQFATSLGLDPARFTGHGFRRGGATWVFTSTQSYDRVQAAGRWACAKTARPYIDEALSEVNDLQLSPAAASMVAKEGAALVSLIGRAVRSLDA